MRQERVQLLTHLIGLFPDGGQLAQYFFTEERGLASVYNIDQTVNLVLQRRQLLIAGRIGLERSAGAELGEANKARGGLV